MKMGLESHIPILGSQKYIVNPKMTLLVYVNNIYAMKIRNFFVKLKVDTNLSKKTSSLRNNNITYQQE